MDEYLADMKEAAGDGRARSRASQTSCSILHQKLAQGVRDHQTNDTQRQKTENLP